MARLKDICTINPKSPGFQDELTVSFVPMPKVGENGEFDPSEIKTYQEVKKGFTYFQNGDVLFAKITPCMENGKGAIAQSLENGVGFGSTEFHVLRPFPKYVTSKWLFYLLSWETFRNEAEKSMTGSAGQKRVPKSFLDEYDVDLPDISTQEKMTDALDKTCYLISLRKQQIAKLDELVKARFVEMFGDLADPCCKFKKCTLAETCLDADDIKCGPFGTQLSKDEYQNEGIAVWEIPQINNGFTSKPTHFLTIEKAEQLKAYSIEPGDIAMSRKGNVGKCGVFPDYYEPGIIHSDVLRIRVDSKRVIPCFMMYQLHFSRAVQYQIETVNYYIRS